MNTINPPHDALPSLDSAQAAFRSDRARGWAALNEVFRAGSVPEPGLHGRYAGELIALDLAPVLTQIAGAIATAWMPWQGKTFDAGRGTGDNIFTRDSLWLARLTMPLYRHDGPDTPETYRAFAFRTYVAAGLADPDRRVLKIDYDLPDNPALTVRRVLDELVQVGPGLYLGKAHVRWWWGAWQMVAYFSLRA